MLSNEDFGVALMNSEGKFWGKIYEDGRETNFWWTDDPRKVSVHDPKYCKKPSDMTRRGDRQIPVMNTGKLVHIKRVTTLMALDKT